MSANTPHRGWAYLVAAGIAVIGSAAFAYQWHWNRPFWVDEEMIALNVRDRGLSELAGGLWLNQAAPVGWLALQRIILLQFGAAERTLRSLPVLFGMATLALAWWAGRRWMGPLGAAVFVLLCAFGLFIAFFPLEAKPYSADVFFGLLVPLLAVWAIEPHAHGEALRLTRITIWWLVVALGQWFSNGALFTAAGCGFVLWAIAWKRAGFRGSLRVALPGLAWLISFGIQYQMVLSHASNNAELQSYWAGGFPPRAAGLSGTLRWFVDQLEPMARDPYGTPYWMAFWISAACGLGLLIVRMPALGLLLLSVPLMAMLLSAFRFVPMIGRLSLWTVPALYAALAFAAEQAILGAWQSLKTRDWARLAPAVALAAVALPAGYNIFSLGRYELSVRPASNHNLDDRSALRFLMSQRQPGDVLVTMKMGLPAIWWYAGVRLAEPNLGRTYQPDGSPILQLSYSKGGADCAGTEWTDALNGRSRVALYLGFDSRTVPGFPELVLDTLSKFGKMVSYRGVAEEGIAAVFDLEDTPTQWAVQTTRPGGYQLSPVVRPPGCVGFRQASRW